MQKGLSAIAANFAHHMGGRNLTRGYDLHTVLCGRSHHVNYNMRRNGKDFIIA
jgi:hypothetical protein